MGEEIPTLGYATTKRGWLRRCWRSLRIHHALLFLGGVLVAGWGISLAAGRQSVETRRALLRWQLAEVSSNLKDLSDLLTKYKLAHGRFPTNDEGLAGLDTFRKRYSISGPVYGSIILGDEPWQTYSILRQETEKANRTGGQIGGFGVSFGDQGNDDPRASMQIDLDIGVAPRGHVVLIAPGGVYSPWLVPYIYENRNGLDAKAFAHSPVDADAKGGCSIRVARGVYVYSVGSPLAAKELDKLTWEDNFRRVAGAGMVVAAFVLVLLLIVRWDSRVGFAFGLAGLVLGAMIGLAPWRTGGPSFRYPYYRQNPQVIALQTKLLGQYRDAGVITRETYDKGIAALEPWKTEASQRRFSQPK